MSFIVNWNGDVSQSPSSKAIWSNKGGIFTPAIGKYKTSFPLPSSYRSAIPSIGIYTITVLFADRADLIANKLYGSEDYWWLVFWLNGIDDPFMSLYAGRQILVADITTVNSLLS